MSGNSEDTEPRTAAGVRWLLVIGVAFLAVRLPVMYRQPGGQDEDYYAVPGLTILQNGIPRLPHVPARDPESVFIRADEALFAEPPLYFYYQSLFYLLLPDVYGTARLASAVAGLGVVVLVYRLIRRICASMGAALWTAGALSISRWFYFPATCARPDMLCALFGLGAVLSLYRWHDRRRGRELVLTGLWVGLGGLTHPFAIVFAVQSAAWVFLASRGAQRVGNVLVVAAVSLGVFCLWLPLIATHPEVFRAQFANQFLHHAQSSLVQRLIAPMPSLAYHADYLWAHLGGLQSSVVLVGLVGGSIAAWRAGNRPWQRLCALAWSSVYLMCVAVGPNHQVLGYWVYPAALMFACVGVLLGWLVRDVGESGGRADEMSPRDAGAEGAVGGWSGRRRDRLQMALGAALLLACLPGSGLRAWSAYVRHAGQVEYNAPAFARRLMKDLPPDYVCAVDTQFALDFVAAGRRTVLAQTLPRYFRVQDVDYDVVVVSRYGIDNQIAEQLEVEVCRTYGRAEDPFACYAQLGASSTQARRRLCGDRAAQTDQPE